MTRTALIVGANGRFGRAAAKSLNVRGWQTRLFARQASEHHSRTSDWRIGDARDAGALSSAAQGCDVIINALTPPYSKWSTEIPKFTKAVISAAQASEAHIIVPGNIYNFGPSMPSVLTEQTPQNAKGTLGRARIKMEQTYKEATAVGVKTLILRAGDFFEREVTGNWFDSQITPKIADGKITYPGTMTSTHCWAYLPDLGRATALCCDKLDRFDDFDTLGFPGYALSGREFVELLERASGKSLKVAGVPWPIIRLLSAFIPDLRGVMEVAYQWRTPHEIDGKRFRSLFPEFHETKLIDAFRDAISGRFQRSKLEAESTAAAEVSHAR